MNKPMVSVLMPAYNAAPYISSAVASIQAQTFADWELIICDDASTDQTPRIIESIAENDPRIKVMRFSCNRGLSAARNAALAVAQGEFLTLQDADDECAPHRLNTLVSFAAVNPQDILMSGYRHCHDPVDGPCDLYLPHELVNAGFWVRVGPPGSTMFLSRRVMQQLGGYRIDLREGEDLDFQLRALLAGYKFRLVPECLYVYRVHPMSLTNKSRKQHTCRVDSYLSMMWSQHLSRREDREALFRLAVQGIESRHWPAGKPRYILRKASSVAHLLSMRFASMGDQDLARSLGRAALDLCWWRADVALSRLTESLGIGIQITHFKDRRLPYCVVRGKAGIVGMV